MPCRNPCRLHNHLAFAYSVGLSSVVWSSEVGPAPPFPPMRVVEVHWSRAVSRGCEVALSERGARDSGRGKEGTRKERKGKARSGSAVSDGSGDGGGHHTGHASLLQCSAWPFFPSFLECEIIPVLMMMLLHGWNGSVALHLYVDGALNLLSDRVELAGVVVGWLSRIRDN